eukprot:m.8811 g.8811  ORF g.8811 m.8811 type:complete len:400 (-) comp3960_c0_seq1:159-1358(-)
MTSLTMVIFVAVVSCILLQAQGDNTCDITKYGASTSSKDNSKAIMAALADCKNNGIVNVPQGNFATNPLVVTGNNVVLNVPEGAMLYAAYGPSNWPKNGGSYIDFITFDNCVSCGLQGKGVIFGKGGRPPVGNDWYYLFDQGKLSSRPMFIVVNGGSNFVMRDITLLDAPQFNVLLDGVQGAEIDHINITSTWYLDPKSKELKEPHNTDGIDPSGGSSNIWIHDVYIHNGDDSVAVKPNKAPCTGNVLVENSDFHYGHGCSIGSVGSGCVENVIFRNITMHNQENGCRVKTYSSTEGSGHVRNITWENIEMVDSGDCITVNANYKAPPKDPKYFINVSDLTFKNVKGSGCKSAASFICPSEAPCTGITLDHVDVEPGGMDCKNAHGKASDTTPKSCLDN